LVVLARRPAAPFFILLHAVKLSRTTFECCVAAPNFACRAEFRL
jgi:hypothetical protein